MDDNLWYKNAVFYEVVLRSFRDSNADGLGDLRGLTEKLDYLADLGVDCLWITPFYPSPLKDDGYDIADYYSINPDYGAVEDLRLLLCEAHARGLRVVADLVLNHTSDQHPWFQAARQDRNSPYRDYYVWSDTDQKYRDARIIFLDTEPSNWTWDPVAGQFYWHRFYASQPDLNYENPAVRDEMKRVLRFWMDLGLDGFRADAVPYLFEEEGTNCENLPATHAYLRELRQMLDEHYPGKILLGEANQWPQDLRPYFGEGDEFHMAFHFPVMPRIFMALKSADRQPIINILESTPPIPETCQWCTFLRNHDELTLEMVTEAERQWMWQMYAPEPRMRLNLGIRRRLAPLLDNDRRKIELAHALLFALPGSPILYYGDEIGMGDNIWLPDRNGVRTPMQWDSGPNAGFSDAPEGALYNPLISEDPYGYANVNVAAQAADPDSWWHTLKRMLAVRKANPVFGLGSAFFLDPHNPAMLAVLREYQGQAVLAAHNLCGDPVTGQVDLESYAGARLIDLFSGQERPSISGPATELTLRPYGYAWYRLER